MYYFNIAARCQSLNFIFSKKNFTLSKLNIIIYIVAMSTSIVLIIGGIYMNLKKLKVSDLKKMAEERHIKNANKLKKDELIESIQGAEENATSNDDLIDSATSLL